MTNTLTTVFYGNDDIRTVVIDKEMWWVLVDVCNIIRVQNSRKLYQKLDDDEKRVIKTDEDGVPIWDTVGRKNTFQVVNESGLYHLLFIADSDIAKQFRRWVTHEVLPRIRKYGYYKLSMEERKNIAYKKIAKLRGEEELADKVYSKMSVDWLETKVKSFEREDELKAEKEDVIKKYPYTYDEADEMCKGELEYIRLFIPKGEEDKYYRIVGGFLDRTEHFSEKFKREVPKLMKKAYKK